MADTAPLGVAAWLMVSLTVLSVLTLGGCGESAPIAKQPAEQTELAELTAETLLIQPMTWPTIVRCQGTLYADETAAVGARVAGRVAAVHADLGDAVQAGQPLVTLQSDEFELLVSQAQAQLAQARSAVGIGAEELIDRLDPDQSPPVRQQRAIWNEAKASLQRATSLLQQNAISQGEFDLAVSAEQVAEATYAAAVNSVREQLSIIGVRRVELALAKQRLEDAVIRAPFDGYVQNRRVAPGTYISAGDWVVSLVRTDPIWFRGTLPERYASQLATGQEITVRIQSMSDPVVATITRISPSLDLASRSLAFEARIENPQQGLRSGLFAQADVVLDPESQSLVVPASAINEFAGSEKVWKLIDGVAQQLEIATGVRRDGFVEIVAGLASGDTILSDATVGRMARVISKEDAPAVAGPRSPTDGRGDEQTSVSPEDMQAASASHSPVGENLSGIGQLSLDTARGETTQVAAAGKGIAGQQGAVKKRVETLAGVGASSP